VPMTMTLRGRAVVEIIVDAITLTAGSLRSPGKYGSSLTLRWRDVTGASDDGPKPPLGDESIPSYSVLGKKASLGGVS